MSDDLRAELQVNGPANIPEFGTVKNSDDFKNLLAISAFHRIKRSHRVSGGATHHGN